MKIKISYLILIAFTAVISFQSLSYAGKGNVWLVDEKGNQYFTCPVMGKTEIVDKNTKFSEYNGEKYYFCCSGCESKFEKNPQKYIGELSLPGNVYEVDGKTRHFACPVCDGKGIVDKDDQFIVHNSGKHYYFCSENCKVEFEKDPQKYIKEMGTH